MRWCRPVCLTPVLSVVRVAPVARLIGGLIGVLGCRGGWIVGVVGGVGISLGLLLIRLTPDGIVEVVVVVGCHVESFAIKMLRTPGG